MAALFASGFGAQAQAAQIDASLIPEYDRAAGAFTGTKFFHIRYEEGGSVASLFSGRTERIEFSIKGTNGSGISELVAAINEALLKAGSPVQVKSANLTYSGVLKGRADSLTLSYSVTVEPEFSGFNLGQGADGRILMDVNWRGFVVSGPVVVESPEHGRIDVNHPIAVLEAAAPEFAGKLLESEAGQIMSQPILDFTDIGERSMEKWHWLFDPTISQVSSSSLLRGDDIGNATVMSVYSLGECSIREGCPPPEEADAEVSIDGEQVKVHTSTPQSYSQIEIAGFTSIEKAGAHEIVVVSMEGPAMILPDFTIQVLMVLGGMMGAIAMFVLVKARK